jgi:glutamate synthase (ferredoxin)
MSGGVAYILDFEEIYCNKSIVRLERYAQTKRCTRSGADQKARGINGKPLGKKILANWRRYATGLQK